MLKLSVVVPFYNVQAYAPDTLRSLAANASSDTEFLLVDDAATDSTPDILDKAAPTIPGARVIHHEVNKGLSGARNTGVAEAEGKYLMFLDGDDWIADGYLEQLTRAMDRLGCDFIRTDHVRVTGRGRSIYRVQEGRRNVVIAPQSAVNPADRQTSIDTPFAWAGINHRRLIDAGMMHFHEELRTAEDRPWIWRLHREAESMAVLGLLGIFYRRGVTTSLTQTANPTQLQFIDSMDIMLRETLADPNSDQFIDKAIRTYLSLILWHHEQRKRFTPELRRKLLIVSADAIERMPEEPRRAGIRGLSAGRQRRLSLIQLQAEALTRAVSGRAA